MTFQPYIQSKASTLIEIMKSCYQLTNFRTYYLVVINEIFVPFLFLFFFSRINFLFFFLVLIFCVSIWSKICIRLNVRATCISLSFPFDLYKILFGYYNFNTPPYPASNFNLFDLFLLFNLCKNNVFFLSILQFNFFV